MKELVDEIVRLSTEYGVLTEYTAFLALDGTDFSQRDALNEQARRSLVDNVQNTRSGMGGVTQMMNNSSQRAQSSSNRANCAIIGATFYNPPSPKFPSDYLGDYFFADYCGYSIRRLDLSTKSASNFASNVTSPVDLKVGPDGALYYLQRGGAVRKISYTGTSNLPPSITDQPDSKTVSVGQSASFTVASRSGGSVPGGAL